MVKGEIHKKSEMSNSNCSEGFISHLTLKEHERLINLVGRRCMVKGKLNGKTELLWDTGSQVSIISTEFLKLNFPNIEIPDVGELLNVNLTLTAANGNSIHYKG